MCAAGALTVSRRHSVVVSVIPASMHCRLFDVPASPGVQLARIAFQSNQLNPLYSCHPSNSLTQSKYTLRRRPSRAAWRTRRTRTCSGWRRPRPTWARRRSLPTRSTPSSRASCSRTTARRPSTGRATWTTPRSPSSRRALRPLAGGGGSSCVPRLLASWACSFRRAGACGAAHQCHRRGASASGPPTK